MSSFLQPLVALANGPHRDRIFVSDLFHVMEDSAVVTLTLLFALPNLASVPPGTSTLLGTPLLFLTIEWALGKQPWLPGALARRSMTRIKFASMIHRVAPWVERVDRLLKPRLQALAHPSAASANNDRSIGEIVRRAMDKVGREGAISIEDGSGLVSDGPCFDMPDLPQPDTPSVETR